jgi:ubiquinol-cytochrome c reductase cytochrome c1 subunit
MRRVVIVLAGALALSAPAAGAAEGPGVAVMRNWSFEGLFGTFDRGALQRGSQVYREVCAACHSMRLLYYRNLAEIGFTEDQVKQIAESVEVEDGPNDQGEMFTRPGRAADRFKSPFANDAAARAANNGAFPPDLSLIVKARDRGANHTFAVLTGYADTPPMAENACRTMVEQRQPDGAMKMAMTAPEVREGQHYNPGMTGCVIAMPPPLSEDVVTYTDGTQATIERMALDVTTFLAWASSPELEERKRTGVKVLLFVFVLTGMLFAVKKKIWKDVAH